MRTAILTALLAIATAAIGLAVASLIAVLRSGAFSDEIGTILWLVAGAMLIAGLCMLSPSSSAESTRWNSGRRVSTRELKAHAVNAAFVLLLASFAVLAVAYLVHSGA